jgi:hypothetical protein
MPVGFIIQVFPGMPLTSFWIIYEGSLHGQNDSALLTSRNERLLCQLLRGKY